MCLPTPPTHPCTQVKQYLKAGTVKLPEELEEEAAAGGGGAAAKPTPQQQKEALAFM
jgi:hypothetical protein